MKTRKIYAGDMILDNVEESETCMDQLPLIGEIVMGSIEYACFNSSDEEESFIKNIKSYFEKERGYISLKEFITVFGTYKNLENLTSKHYEFLKTYGDFWIINDAQDFIIHRLNTLEYNSKVEFKKLTFRPDLSEALSNFTEQKFFKEFLNNLRNVKFDSIANKICFEEILKDIFDNQEYINAQNILDILARIGKPLKIMFYNKRFCNEIAPKWGWLKIDDIVVEEDWCKYYLVRSYVTLSI